MMMISFQNVNEEKLRNIAKEFSKILFEGSVILLEGDLGAGKTTFVRYLVEALDGKIRDVTSPTFTIVNEYDARFHVYHIDLFRINEQEVEDLPIEYYLESDGACLIEWPNMLKSHMPDEFFMINFQFVDENLRNIVISSKGNLYDKVLLRGDFSVEK